MSNSAFLHLIEGRGKPRAEQFSVTADHNGLNVGSEILVMETATKENKNNDYKFC